MRAICILKGLNVQGKIFFEQKHRHLTRIYGEIYGLKSVHGFHIHEYGDFSDGCKSMGEHYNPHSKKHGGLYDKERHEGDLGNITSDLYGVTHVNIHARLNLNEVLGRSLVVHYDKDDLGKGNNETSLKTGNSGSRIACGIIGLTR